MNESRYVSSHASAGLLFAAGIVVIGYSLLFLFATPALSFEYDPHTGLITHVDSKLSALGIDLRPGDRLLSIADRPLPALARQDAPSIASLVHGNQLQITIQRAASLILLNLPTSYPNAAQRLLRVLQMMPALVFLASAEIIYLLIRPRRPTILLLMALLSLGAIWLAAQVVAEYNLRWSESFMRASVWLLVPYGLHFAWRYPKPILPLRPVWVTGFFAFFTILALLDFLQQLPLFAYRWGVFVLGAGLPILIVLQWCRAANQYRYLRAVLISIAVVVSAASVFAILEQIHHSRVMSTLSLSTLTGIPMAYFFPIFRRQSIDFEVRANRSLVLVSFIILTLILFISASLLLTWLLPDPHIAIPTAVILSACYVLLAVVGYPNYSAWAQRHLLGIHVPSREMMQHFTQRITTTLEVRRLARVLYEELAPSLLIRQFVFVRLNEAGQPVLLDDKRLAFVDPPSVHDIPLLLETAGRYLPPIPTIHLLDTAAADAAAPLALAPVRLILKLVVDSQLIGLALFGRRDPDDFYSSSEIVFLQTLMDQAALALLNIVQAENLHNLYQANVQRTEIERQRMARELHDDVLGPMAVMMMKSNSQTVPEGFLSAYQIAVNRIRAIIEGLRPSTLDFGLMLAVEDLSSQITNYANHKTQIVNQVKADAVRYPAEVEMQIYRILQEACQNAVLHGKANQIVITGRLEDHWIELTVSDDGAGFRSTGFISDGLIDLAALLRRRHYGLAGIYERAALIGATVKIESAPNQGTRLAVQWTDSTP